MEVPSVETNSLIEREQVLNEGEKERQPDEREREREEGRQNKASHQTICRIQTAGNKSRIPTDSTFHHNSEVIL